MKEKIPIIDDPYLVIWDGPDEQMVSGPFNSIEKAQEFLLNKNVSGRILKESKYDKELLENGEI